MRSGPLLVSVLLVHCASPQGTQVNNASTPTPAVATDAAAPVDVQPVDVAFDATVTAAPNADPAGDALELLALDRDGGMSPARLVPPGNYPSRATVAREEGGGSFGFGGLGVSGTGWGGGGNGDGTIGFGGSGTPSPTMRSPRTATTTAPRPARPRRPTAPTATPAPTPAPAHPGSDRISAGESGLGLRGPSAPVTPPGGTLPSRPTSPPSVSYGAPTIAGMLDPTIIRRIIRRNLTDLRRCYERGRAENPSAEGRLSLSFMINAEGRVISTAEASSSLPSPTISRCVAGAVQRWSFPPTGHMVRVTYPFVFEGSPEAYSAREEPMLPHPTPATRLLTAASVSDADRVANYREYLTRHPNEQRSLELDPSQRMRFRVVDPQGLPVHDAELELRSGAFSIRARTHADGVWDFFPSIDPPPRNTPLQLAVTTPNGTRTERTVQVANGRDEVVQTTQPRVLSSLLELALVIDVTGSMEDELRYLNRELVDIVRRVRESVPNVEVRVSATFYGDRGDAYLVRQIPFSRDLERFTTVMNAVYADGGGDYPEDVNAGLQAAFERLRWSSEQSVRIVLLLADAPPQRYGDENFTWRTAMRMARERGIRLLPVAASGADRETEYLFRALGAYTSTPYVYLTDDSGVGGPHQEADTDRVAVERFNDLLVRVLLTDLQGNGMHEPIAN